MRIALKIAYDGRKFIGFARQPRLKTVEGEILKILTKNNLIKNIKESYFRVASRTDKGVSAFGNVIAINSNKSKNEIIKSFSDNNSEIIIYGISEVNEDFNPRHAKQRHYRYYLKNNNLDVEKIIQSSKVFIGDHNFSNFARVESFRNPIRIIDDIKVKEEKSFIILDFFAQSYLWHQIRKIISSLEKVGICKIELNQIVDALDNPEKNVDFGLAPPEYLILKDIIFNIDFEYDIKLFKELCLLKKDFYSSMKL